MPPLIYFRRWYWFSRLMPTIISCFHLIIHMRHMLIFRHATDDDIHWCLPLDLIIFFIILFLLLIIFRLFLHFFHTLLFITPLPYFHFTYYSSYLFHFLIIFIYYYYFLSPYASLLFSSTFYSSLLHFFMLSFFHARRWYFDAIFSHILLILTFGINTTSQNKSFRTHCL